MTDLLRPRAIGPNWRGLWLLAGAADALARDRDHLTLALPGLSLTAQNFRGERRAFWNVCSHRGIEMRAAGCGSGLLRCPYHGWTYDADGVPAGIPDNDAFFGLDRAARSGLALRRAGLAVVDGWLLLNGDGAAEAPTGLAGPVSQDWLVAETIERAPASGDGLIRIERIAGWLRASQDWPLDDGTIGRRHLIFHPDRPPLADAPFVALG